MEQTTKVERVGDRFRCGHCQRIYLDFMGAEDCLQGHNLVYVGGTEEDWKIIHNILSQAIVEWNIQIPANTAVANIARAARKESLGTMGLKKKKK